MKRILAFLLVVLCAASCDWFSPDKKERQVVLLYFAANNSLSLEGESDVEVLKNGWLPGLKEKEKVVLVYRHFTDQTPVLSRLSLDKKGNTVEEVIREYPFDTNSAQVATLKAVIADAEAAWPAQRHSIVLWSHGSGFLPEGYYTDPAEQGGGASLLSFAEDHGTEMEISALRDALSRFHYEFVLMDCCLMGNVEVAYELRNCCDYIVFSPTEILSDGFPYESMMEPVFTHPAETAMKIVCKSYMDQYLKQSGVYQSATVTLVRTSALERLAAACKPIFQQNQQQILTLDRSRVQPYFRFNKHWFYDLDDFVGLVSDEAQYTTFISALDQAVIYKDATPEFIGIKIQHYSGLSIYIPRADYTVLNNYYKTLAWNQATGLVQ